MSEDTGRLSRERLWTLIAVFFFAAVVLVSMQASVTAGDKTAAKRMATKQAFELYQNKCLGCHDSVADPEKPGRTRDDWYLVVNVMHDYGLALTADEGDAIVQLLYELRKGMERDAG
jgi:hypothetical protein